ncbi:MAG: DUF4177 domain-containing protein [Patescibacteria group bacterium]|jgi:hypothetical protein
MWEHKVVTINSGKEQLQKELDNASLDGWQLVSVTTTDDGFASSFYLFFKRPKQ